jgi:hypothetical protein
MVALRFSWYVGLFASYEEESSSRALSALEKSPRRLCGSFDIGERFGLKVVVMSRKWQWETHVRA